MCQDRKRRTTALVVSGTFKYCPCHIELILFLKLLFFLSFVCFSYLQQCRKSTKFLLKRVSFLKHFLMTPAVVYYPIRKFGMFTCAQSAYQDQPSKMALCACFRFQNVSEKTLAVTPKFHQKMSTCSEEIFKIFIRTILTLARECPSIAVNSNYFLQHQL